MICRRSLLVSYKNSRHGYKHRLVWALQAVKEPLSPKEGLISSLFNPFIAPAVCISALYPKAINNKT